MTCATSSDNSLKLISFHPYDFFNTFITPKFQTARSNLKDLSKHHSKQKGKSCTNGGYHGNQPPPLSLNPTTHSLINYPTLILFSSSLSPNGTQGVTNQYSLHKNKASPPNIIQQRVISERHYVTVTYAEDNYLLFMQIPNIILQRVYDCILISTVLFSYRAAASIYIYICLLYTSDAADE